MKQISLLLSVFLTLTAHAYSAPAITDGRTAELVQSAKLAISTSLLQSMTCRGGHYNNWATHNYGQSEFGRHDTEIETGLSEIASALISDANTATVSEDGSVITFIRSDYNPPGTVRSQLSREVIKVVTASDHKAIVSVTLSSELYVDYNSTTVGDPTISKVWAAYSSDQCSIQ